MSISYRSSALVSANCLLLLLTATSAQAGTYYVATSGDDGDDGTSPEQAWATVTHAAKQAVAGDVIYIKAGLYLGEDVQVKSSGSEGAPIIFQGYAEQPGDTPDPHYTPGGTLDSTLIPVLQGEAGAGTGIGFYEKSYIEIRNLGITMFNYGIFPQTSDHILIENVYVVKQGTDGGQGIWLRDCTNSTLRNSVVADASMCNIIFERTQDSVIENCASYAVLYDPAAAATDYHIVLKDGQNNIVRNCSARNLHWQQTGTHPGHGIGIKDTAQTDGYPYPHSSGNRITDCAAYDLGEYFFVAHEALDNVFENCTAQGQFRDQNSWSEGINIRDGAHDNTFRNIRVEGTRTSVALQDTAEGPKPGGTPLVQIASKNTLTHCVFADSNKGIELWNADDNLFVNCVFDQVGEWALVRSPFSREDQGNTCRNSIVTRVPGSFQEVDAGTAPEIAFTYTDFFGNTEFEMPAGAGNLALDPLYANTEQRDYHLQSREGRFDEATSSWVKDAQQSPCIDAGNPGDDFSSEPCPNGGRIDLGAYGGTAHASMGSLNGGGCGCESGDTRECYDGPEGTAGIGACRSGEQVCSEGIWDACAGTVTPGAEVCGDGEDNDCDGSTDEGEECVPCSEDPTCSSKAPVASGTIAVGKWGCQAQAAPSLGMLGLWALALLGRRRHR